MELFGSQAGKSFTEVVAHLTTKDRPRARPSPVGTLLSVFQHIAKKVQVLVHDPVLNHL